MVDSMQSEAAQTAFSKLSQIALARAHVLGLLAFAYYDPTEAFAAQLVQGSYVSEINGYFQDLTTSHPNAQQALDLLMAYQTTLINVDPSELLKTLKVEHARLFIGPGKMVVPPYETFYRSTFKEDQPMLMVSEAAMEVEKAYRECGVALANNLNEPPDYVATEMEFLFYLCKQESNAWAAGNNAAAKKWRRRQLAFMDGHLGTWGRQFAEAVEKESNHPFYQAVAHFTAAFILLEGSETALNDSETDDDSFQNH